MVLVDLLMVLLVWIVFLKVCLVIILLGFRLFLIICMMWWFVICVMMWWWLFIVGIVVLFDSVMFNVLVIEVMVDVVFMVL